ncbi:MAG: SGNH/GDSL hydrolase family protein [Deltaproteobacteria bacterium]|nr:SGNH/GDSL hydrolase family protein [Deltaproteobacteria bacterium]
MTTKSNEEFNGTRPSVVVRALTWAARHQVRVFCALALAAVLIAEIWLHALPFPPYAADMLFYQAADLSVHRESDDPKLLIELTPGAKDVYERPGQTRRVVSINRLGLRGSDRDAAKPGGIFRVLMLGSSTTFGASVSDDETLSAQMERRLNATGAGRYEVWNAGVNSYGPAQMAALGDRLLAGGASPDLIVFQLFLTGPRAFLKDRPRIEPFEKDSTLAAEYFVLPSVVGERAPGWLVARSRLALLLLAHGNRMIPSEQMQERLVLVQREHHRRALAGFVARHASVAPIRAFVMPCADPAEVADLLELAATSGLDPWCVPPEVDTQEYLDAHPAPHVYDSYARLLIDRWCDENLLGDACRSS